MYKRGTIVLVPFPFTDLTGAKVRPALIISTSLPGDDVVVLFISSKRVAIGKFDVLVEPTKQNGLKITSVIKSSKIATLDKKMILGELGSLESKTMSQVAKKLRLILLCGAVVV